jgi:cyclohexanecarboxylate-CoA ligase
VADIAVVAAPDARMGEIACAFIVTRSGAPMALSDIAAFLSAAGMARQKTPERLEFVHELPRNPTGKILKHELRAQLRAHALPSI